MHESDYMNFKFHKTFNEKIKIKNIFNLYSSTPNKFHLILRVDVKRSLTTPTSFHLPKLF